MKKVYVVCPDRNSFPLGIFETREDALNFMEFWQRINYTVEEFCLWEKGQQVRQIINAQIGLDHASYARRYYGYPHEQAAEIEKERKEKEIK